MAMPIAELIEHLKTFPKDATWYGIDDESLMIIEGEDEIGYIEPSGKVQH